MANAHEAFLRKMRIKNSTVFFSITNRCNSHCRHCINIGGKTVLGEAEPKNVLNWIEQVAQTSYRTVNFVGGEPFLLLDDLQQYVAKANSLGLVAGVTTNGFWASSETEAVEILNSLPGLKTILVSTDPYHLEYIDAEKIHNLIRAALKLNSFVAVNATCASRKEGEEVKALFAEYRDRVFVNVSAMMAAGAAEALADQLERFDCFADVEQISDFCGVRDHFVNYQGGVDACCMATLGLNTHFLSLGDLQTQSFAEILEQREAHPIYRLLAAAGPRGLAKLMVDTPFEKQLTAKRYTCECDLCVEVLNNPESHAHALRMLTEKGEGQ